VKLRPWMIDMSIWTVLCIAFLGLLWTVVQLTLPPTPAQVQARLATEARALCLAHPSTALLVTDMRDDVCGCMADRVTTSLGGLDQGDFDQCRQRVAQRMTSHPDLDSAFAANFAPACGRMEGQLTGRATDGTTPFCGCLQEETAAAPAAKAAYAFGGGEVPSGARDARVRTCSPMLVFGEGWKAGGEGFASMRLPPLLPFQQMVLRCFDAGLRVEVLDGTLPVRSAVTFMEESDPNPVLSSTTGVIGEHDAYTLTDKLSLRTEIEVWTEDSGYGVTLAGFREAAAHVLATCPENVPATPAVGGPQGLVDVWETADAGRYYIPASPISDWWGTLVCDWPPPYLTLQGPVVQRVIERFPDPTGARLATGVPVELMGDNVVLFSGETFCDHGADEGDTESCFLALDRRLLDTLFASGSLGARLGGETLEPVGFGGSAAIQSSRAMCYRSLED
jgi:hypothetical protein